MIEDTDSIYQFYSSKRQEVAYIVRRKSFENKCKLGCVTDILITDISKETIKRALTSLVAHKG